MHVLRGDVRLDILQERGLLRLGEEPKRHRTSIYKPNLCDVVVLDVCNHLTAALRSLRKSKEERRSLSTSSLVAFSRVAEDRAPT